VVFLAATAGVIEPPERGLDAMPAGVSNRVVATAPAGLGREVAAQAAQAVRALWVGWVRQTFGRDLATPGAPRVVWAWAPASIGDYEAQWRQAQAVLTARRRVRHFEEVVEERRWLCSLSPRWVSEDALPAGLTEHEHDVLSAANWVKRLWRLGRVADAGVRRGFTPSAISSRHFGSTCFGGRGSPRFVMRWGTTCCSAAVGPGAGDRDRGAAATSLSRRNRGWILYTTSARSKPTLRKKTFVTC